MENDNTEAKPLIKHVKSFLLLAILIGIISSIFTFIKKSPEDGFISQWLPYYAWALLIVLPVAIVIIRRLNEVIGEHFQNHHPIIKSLAFALPFAVVVGSLMIGIAVVRFTQDFEVSQFYTLWGRELKSSCSVILMISLSLVGVVKSMLVAKKKRSLLNML